jgi:peptide/nickel transport system substrate-binding protein
MLMSTAALMLAGGLIGVEPAYASSTFVIAKAADPQSLDPAQTMDNNDWTVTYRIYQRLVKYEVSPEGKGLTSVTGDLAKSWEVSPDGLTWVFKIAEGNAFSDGTPVDAQAVEYSFQRLFALGQGPSEAFPKGILVNATGPMEVTFQLPEAFAPFLYTLANNGASIVSPSVDSKGGQQGTTWLAGNSAGSGPFMLASWEKGQSIVLKPNPHYGGKAPALSNVRIDIIPEASARRLKLEAGDAQIAEGLPNDQLDALANSSNVVVKDYPSLLVTYLYLNNAKAPLDQVTVRKALSYAIDYSAIIDGVIGGHGKQMRGPIPDGMWGAKADTLQYSLDLTKAKSLLASAPAISRPITFLYSDRDPNWEPIAIATQAFLAQVGINVKLEKLANATMRERIDKGDFDIAIGNWSPDFADPYMFTNYWFDSARKGLAGNRSFFKNPNVDALLAAAAKSVDQAERAALYGDVQDIVTDEAAYVYLFQKDYRIAMSKSVTGFVFNPMLQDIYNIDNITVTAK